VKTNDFGDPVFKPYVLRPINGVSVAIIGQAFPYTPIANPRYFVPEWTFGIQEEEMQKVVTDARAKGAQVVVLLSHNGMDVDLKMASRVTGIDAILGGHTHDGVPQPTLVANGGGKTIVSNAGSNGKFLASSTSTSRPARSRTFATGCCRYSAPCCRRIPRWTR
jgi:sulfur-oxidizing protein SoxB